MGGTVEISAKLPCLNGLDDRSVASLPGQMKRCVAVSVQPHSRVDLGPAQEESDQRQAPVQTGDDEGRRPVVAPGRVYLGGW